jgi:hypothetical protein
MRRKNMEPLSVSATTTQKLPYAPPKATFIPLKLEERLLACTKYTTLETVVCGTSSAS